MDLRLWLNKLVMISLVSFPTPLLVVSAHYFDSPSFIDLMQHVAGNASGQALTPIPGSNGHSTAYNLQGSSRYLKVSHRMVDRVRQLLETKEEFTLVAAFKQQEKNTGSIISITSHDTRVLELESSGRRDELRLHYTHRGRLRTETFPYKLADNQWHMVALSFSSVYVEVFIDCKKVYERSISWLQEDWSHRMSIWIGQRDAFHAYFKGAIEYISFIDEPNGILEVCPHANIACPSCSQFRQLQHSIKQLYDRIEQLNSKLESAEQRISDLEQCECRLSCRVGDTTYSNGDTWPVDDCTSCTCKNGVVDCQPQVCPPVNCSKPFKVEGRCCPTCGKQCFRKGKKYDDGESYKKNLPNSCALCTCRNGAYSCERVLCQPPPCPPEEQIEVADECCRKCKNVKFCENGHDCHDNATCYDMDTSYSCHCNPGFNGNGHDCQDVDECALRGGNLGHYCGRNTRCVNTVGSYQCQCEHGYIRESTTQCREHNECATRQHTCDAHADCDNVPGSYTCTCQAGYQGDGFTCTPVCRNECQNGGVCVSPNVCRCRKGFIGRRCAEDLDECKFSMDQCDPHSECINIPGSYFCKCRQGFYSNQADNRHGRLCHDIDECGGWGGGHSCPAGTTCENTPGAFVCQCTTPRTCTGCRDDHNRWHSNGTSWKLRGSPCNYQTCVTGTVRTYRAQCDCDAEDVDVKCCPRCSAVGQCNFNTHNYSNNQRWVHQCQHCQCLGGEVDCWPMQCPRLACNRTTTLPGDCCPRCVGQQDPCQAVSSTARVGGLSAAFLQEFSHTCTTNSGNYSTGNTWTLMAAECTTCECKEGHVCCQFSQNGCDNRKSTQKGGRHSRNRKGRQRSSRRRRADRG